jgi:hypothetical protein
VIATLLVGSWVAVGAAALPGCEDDSVYRSGNIPPPSNTPDDGAAATGDASNDTGGGADGAAGGASGGTGGSGSGGGADAGDDSSSAG